MIDKLETTLIKGVTAGCNGLRVVRDYFKKLWKEIKDVGTAFMGRD